MVEWHSFASGEYPTGHRVIGIDSKTEPRQLLQRRTFQARCTKEQAAVAGCLVGVVRRHRCDERLDREPGIAGAHVRESTQKQQSGLSRSDQRQVVEIGLSWCRDGKAKPTVELSHDRTLIDEQSAAQKGVRSHEPSGGRARRCEDEALCGRGAA